MKKTWKTMKKWERRVAIARDVIKLVNRPKIKIKQGTYFLEKNGREPDFGPQVKSNHECQVCAKGGLMLAFMEKTQFACPVVAVNGVDIQQSYHSKKYERELDNAFIVKALSGTFVKEQLDLVERCFEGWQYHRTGPSSDFAAWYDTQAEQDDIVEDYLTQEQKDVNKAVRKFRKVKNIKRRLFGIMGNIIHNRGEFVPEQGPIFTTRMSRKAVTA